jgi:DNA-binding CsgD family transcriptional regulator
MTPEREAFGASRSRREGSRHVRGSYHRLRDQANRIELASRGLREAIDKHEEAEERLAQARNDLRAAVVALNEAGATMEEIGHMMGVSRQRVQQLTAEYQPDPTPEGLKPSEIDLVRRYAEAPESIDDVAQPLPEHPARPKLQLTRIEERMLTMLSEGKTVHDIGQELGLERRKIRSALAELYAKLGVTTRAEILRLIREWRG